MTDTPTGGEPVARPCANCLAVDDLPRNMIDVGLAETVKFHLTADPHPDIDEPPAESQFRAALEIAGITPPERIQLAEGDCADPAIHAAPQTTVEESDNAAD